MPAVRRLLEATLGAGARQVPHLWVHIVPAVDGARGWGPHKDGGQASRSRSHLSVWIALTEASTRQRLHLRAAAVGGVGRADCRLVNRRDADRGRRPAARRGAALPVSAGAALAWDFDLLHWSGVRRGGGGARRSLSLEFIAAEAAPLPDEHPLLACGAGDPLPDFGQRLAFIAQGIIQYGKHEPGVQRFRPLAERLLSRPV